MNHTVVQREKRQKQEESRPNLTGIPSQMKRDFEVRSQMSYDDVRVHYNSDLPAKVGALAYTQGTQVYLGPGQGRHLRHELTHVAQQKAGLVAPTIQIGGLPVNNDPTLERLADSGIVPRVPAAITVQRQVLQRVPGDTQNSKPLPSIAEIAIQRLCELLFPGQAVPNGLTQKINYLSNRLGQLKGTNKHIRMILKNCGVSKELADQMTFEITKKEYDKAVSLFCDYYFQFDCWNGQDLNELDPRGQGINQNRHFNLICLKEVLEKFVLPRIKKAVKKGKIAKLNPLGQGVKYLQSDKKKKGNLAFKLDNRDLIEGTTRFNYIAINQTSTNQKTVPEKVTIGLTPFGGTTVSDVRPPVGEEEYGFAAGPSQVMHEHGHLLENSLGVNDFANLHRFLRMRSKQRNQGKTGWGISGSGWGYVAELPPMAFQNWLSRHLPSRHSAFLCGLFNMGNWSLSLATKLITLGLARDQAQRFVDDFFLQESNSETSSYATQIYSDYGTEFVSTTAELLSTERGAEKLIEADPTRVALFFYLADKTFYRQLDGKFRESQRQSGAQVIRLDDFLHIK